VQTPTIDEIRRESPLIAEKLSPDNDGDNDKTLRARIIASSALVSSLTFRLIDPVSASPDPLYLFEEVPPGLVPLAVQAIALLTERQVVGRTVKEAEKTASGRRLRSISAGPWSESYFGPGETKTGGSTRPMMDADPFLDQLLWALATLAAREYFIQMATGQVAPAAGFVNPPWGRAMRGL
jgi:hypothetical protein